MCMDWLLELFRHRPADGKSKEKGSIIARICRQTFHVDSDVLFAVFNSERDLGDFIECTARSRCYTSSGPFFDTTLAHRMEPHLHRLVITNNDWFHSAILRILPSYVPGGEWEVLQAPNDRWIKINSGGNDPMSIYYNLRDGTCIVNGSKGTSLPDKYTRHSLYKQICGVIIHLQNT